MPLARVGSALLFFAHIPKTGGTSVEAYLTAKGRMALHYSKSDAWLRCSPQHIHAEAYGALFPPGFFDHAFCVLRDPVARLKSEYRYRIGHAETRGKTIEPFDDWVPQVFRRFAKNPYMLDNHIRPQAQFLSPGMKLFRLEDGLDLVFDWIDAVTGDATPGTAGMEKEPWPDSRRNAPRNRNAHSRFLCRGLCRLRQGRTRLDPAESDPFHLPEDKKRRPQRGAFDFSELGFDQPSELSISLQALTRPFTALTDLSNIACSSLLSLMPITRSTPPAPITVGTPT